MPEAATSLRRSSGSFTSCLNINCIEQERPRTTNQKRTAWRDTTSKSAAATHAPSCRSRGLRTHTIPQTPQHIEDILHCSTSTNKLCLPQTLHTHTHHLATKWRQPAFPKHSGPPPSATSNGRVSKSPPYSGPSWSA